MNRSEAVGGEVGLTLVVPEQGGVPLTASLSYRGDDPYAIRMAFHIGMDEPVEWIFGRDLLAAAMREPAGEGDVRIWPGTEPGRKVLNISLSSPFGHAHFEAPLPAMAQFLRRTCELIPLGRERDFTNIDGELDELLRWA